MKTLPAPLIDTHYNTDNINNNRAQGDTAKLEMWEEILHYIPKTLKVKDIDLLDRISNAPGIGWNAQGELIFDDRVIKGTHIVDLVSDLIGSCKQDPLHGFREFAQALRWLSELIGNPHCLDYLRNDLTPSLMIQLVNERLLKQTEKWLSAQESYTLHKQVCKRYERRRAITGESRQQSQADLTDMSRLSKHNDNFKFSFTCMDVFSKKAHVVPIKSKSPVEVIKGFKNFEEHLPFSLNTDKGMEFKGKVLQDWLRKRHVKYFTSQDQIVKCSIVEWFNRTILSILYQYFTKNNTLRYVDVLPKLVRN